MSEALLRDYLGKVEKYYKAGKATEHTYRGDFKTLLEELDNKITATNEPKRVKCGAPDYVVERNNLTIGYIEAKDVNVPLDKIEKDEQLGRYRRALDNLILTDYIKFHWYVNGEKRMTATLANPKDKRLILDKEGARQVEELLKCFLEHNAEPIRKPRDLASRMARLAHLIRDMIIKAFDEKEASDTLRDLYEAFQETLLPELSEAEFADMFAQTLAYGLFAARYNHTGRKLFTRSDAAKEIPRTNPFLRKLFGTIAGPDLDDEPFVGFVDDLAQTLAVTDMDAVLADFGKATHQQDPIVHFYETFLSQYDPKMRELRGVYYTPTPVVSYIVSSVDYLLREHFDCPDGLADTGTTSYIHEDEAGEKREEQSPRVLILDPATGTSTFLYYVIKHIRESYQAMGNAGMWSSYVREHLLPRIFGFELLMAPYAMAHLKLGMQLAAIDLPKQDRKTWAYDFQTEERLGIYLTNTLDEALKRSQVMFGRYISDEANEAAKVKQTYPVMVVLGNPPYSGHSANKGQWINDLLRGKDSQTGKITGNYFEVDGKPLGERNPKWLNDDYVKFIRFAQWRIDQTGYGILAFITNHGYLDNPTFRGMRQSLMQSFDDIYILDLHGNSKKKERSPDGSKDENVFDIQQGVAIGIFVKRQRNNIKSSKATTYHAHLWGPREVYAKADQHNKLIGGKYYWLEENDITTTQWAKLEPQSPFYWFIPQNITLQVEYERAWQLTDIMPVNVLGFQTHRDHFAISFEKEEMSQRINELRNTNLSDEDIAEKYELVDSSSWKIANVRKKLQANKEWQNSIIQCLYRPFDWRYCYFGEVIMDRPRRELLENVAHKDNLCLLSSRQQATQGYRHSWITKEVANDCVISTTSREANQVFPLYTYPSSKPKGLFDLDEPSPSDQLETRIPNLSKEFIANLSMKLNMKFISDNKGNLQDNFGPEDVFYYIYAILQAPSYRDRYSPFLKSSFPRIPITSNPDLFHQLCTLGKSLADLHSMTNITKISSNYPEAGNNFIEKIDYHSASNTLEKGRVFINKTQYFGGVLPEVWEFQVGGYQVCQKWLKDRKGRTLSFNDIKHYQKIVTVLGETITLMERIDETIEEHGSWPLE